MRNFRKMIAAFSMVAILSTLVVSTAFAGTYTDVPETSTYYAAVETLAAAGVLDTTKTTFGGTEQLKRAEAVKLAVLAAGYDLESPAKATFTDVPKTAWYYTYVETAASHGIVDGTKGMFYPMNNLNRAQYAKMLVEGLALPAATPVEPTFTDVPATHWSYGYVETAYAWTVLGGYGDGIFKPANPVTRFQAAVMTDSAMNPVERDGAVVEDDDDDDDDDDDNGELEGGAGSVEVDAKSTYNNEEVGEGSEEVKVMAFEIEADDSSDVEITSLKLEFAQTVDGNSDKMDDYMTEVAVLFSGEVVGTADPADFSENSDVYTKFVTLENAIVRAGEKEIFTVAVTGVDNLDSGDIDNDNWTVDVLNVRFMDGEGIVTTDAFSTDALLKNFDFADFATANDVELEADLTDENPEEGVAIVKDNSTEEVLLMSYTFTATGSDMVIEDLEFDVTTVGVNVEDVGEDLILRWDDGASEQSESLSAVALTEAIVFEELDIDLAKDEEMVFEVWATIGELDGTPISEGNTIVVVLDVSETVATDSADEDVTELTGSADGEIQHLFTVAPVVTYVSSSVVPVPNGDAASESATVTLVLDVQALGGTIYLNGDDEGTDLDEAFVAVAVGADTLDAYEFVTSGNYTVTNSGEEDEYYKITEGKTMRVTINGTVTQAAAATVLGGLGLDEVQFGTVTTSSATRSANVMDWSDLLDNLRTPKTTLVGVEEEGGGE